MTDIFERLGAELHTAAERSLPRGGLGHRTARSVRRTGLVVATGMVLAGAAAAASGVWQPILGDGSADAPRAANSPVPTDEAQALGVLRRSQTDADRGPDVRAQLKLLVGAEDHGVRLEGVRRLGSTGAGAAIVLVPQERAGEEGPSATRTPSDNVLCVMVPNPASNVLGRQTSARSCWTLRTILAGKADGLAPIGAGYSYYGLVPDGVSTVVIRHADGSETRASVHDNFFDARSNASHPTDAAAATAPTWLDADNKPVQPRVASEQ